MRNSASHTAARSTTQPVPRPWLYQLHESVPIGEEHSFNGAHDRGDGGEAIDTEEMMETYDALPKVVREALGAADHPWAPTWAWYVIRVKIWPLEAIVRRIEQADREEARRRRLQLLLGKG